MANYELIALNESAPELLAPTASDTGTITNLSAGQIIVDNLTFNGAAITSDTGAISFGNENLTTTGTLGCGAITTSEDLTFSNANPVIYGGDVDGYIGIVPGTTLNEGGNIILYGSSHATLANDISVRGGSSDELYYDHSASEWDFQANAITTTGSIGVGASPSYPVHVTKSIDSDASVAVTNTNSGNSAIARLYVESEAGNGNFFATSTTYNAITGAADSLVINANNLSGGIKFAIDGVVKASMDTDGAIGVNGVTPPSQAAHIADPTGGATTDAEARAAIDAILVVLENVGFTATS